MNEKFIVDSLDYNESNLKKVSDCIRDNLTTDLLDKKAREENLKRTGYGYCHMASAVLFLIFGDKKLRLQRKQDDNDIWHWWCEDCSTGEVIDLTSEQYKNYGIDFDYSDSETHEILGWRFDKQGNLKKIFGSGYAEKVMTLYRRVTDDLQGKKGSLEDFI